MYVWLPVKALPTEDQVPTAAPSSSPPREAHTQRGTGHSMRWKKKRPPWLNQNVHVYIHIYICTAAISHPPPPQTPPNGMVLSAPLRTSPWPLTFATSPCNYSNIGNHEAFRICKRIIIFALSP